jgi:hypothetical protein
MIRHGRGFGVGVALLSTFFFGCGGKSAPPAASSGGPPPVLALTALVSGLSSPVDLQFPNDGSARMFVVQQGGAIRIAANGSLVPAPFLDITAKVDAGGEKGLLGLAFHPQFPQNHLFYVHYDRIFGGQMESVIAEYQVSASDPNLADPNSERIWPGRLSLHRLRRWRRRWRHSRQRTKPADALGENASHRRR